MTYSIESVETHAELSEDGKQITQWAEITLLIPKGFDWDRGSAKLLKQLRFAVELIGRGDA